MFDRVEKKGQIGRCRKSLLCYSGNNIECTASLPSGASLSSSCVNSGTSRYGHHRLTYTALDMFGFGFSRGRECHGSAGARQPDSDHNPSPDLHVLHHSPTVKADSPECCERIETPELPDIDDDCEDFVASYNIRTAVRAGSLALEYDGAVQDAISDAGRYCPPQACYGDRLVMFEGAAVCSEYQRGHRGAKTVVSDVQKPSGEPDTESDNGVSDGRDQDLTSNPK